ncbi:MAG: recombination protein O N-terminal domain-containing protein [Minisyncoccia bacterium]
MYEKYQTEALILRSYERGEADRIYALFTHDFGFLWARCSAVRRESSKMRYALQPGALANVSLVRGNRGWRIAGTMAIARIDPSERSAVQSFTRMGQLLERLSAGEEVNTYLFDALRDAHAALIHEPKEAHPVIELVAVARLLYALGYLSTEALGTALFAETSYAPAHLAEAATVRSKLLSSVNKALSETQL